MGGGFLLGDVDAAQDEQKKTRVGTKKIKFSSKGPTDKLTSNRSEVLESPVLTGKKGGPAPKTSSVTG